MTRGEIVLRRTGGTKARPRGNYTASWRDADGRVTWNTGTSNEAEARRLAVDERAARRAQPVASSSSSSPPPPPRWVDLATRPIPPPADPPPPPRPLADALSKAFAEPAPPPTTSNELVVSDQAVEAESPKARRLHDLFGKTMALVCEGALKRAVKWAGREPDDLDDDEAELLREGWRDLGVQWFGRVEIGPWGKVVLGSVAAGAGMYMGGKPIEKEKPAALPPADGGGAGGG